WLHFLSLQKQLKKLGKLPNAITLQNNSMYAP
ncbi:MAG: hypothetical protein ACI9WV_001254, partial [Patiriisocius sp.]